MVKSRARLVSTTFGGLVTAIALFVLLPLSAASASAGLAYHIKPGDTLWKIAVRYHTTISALSSANHIANPNFIMAGQTLTVTPGNSTSPGPVEASTQTWTAPAATTEAVDPAPAAAPAPAPAAAPAPAPVATSDSGIWACIAQHESGGNPAEDTGNGFYGAYQFTLSSWAAAGGAGLPQDASISYQTQIAEHLQQMQGWSAWPVTSVICGV